MTAVSTKRDTHKRFRGLIMPTGSHPAIRRVKREGHAPSIHGNKLWKSSCLIIDYLHKQHIAPQATVIDVGCGWGASGIWCAKNWQASVTSMDADEAVFPYLNTVAALNGVQTKPLKQRFEQTTKKQLAAFDMLLGADICFWDELVKPVNLLINRALDAGVKHIVIADPERPTFHEMAERCIDKHGGELLQWRTKGALEASGALLVIHNC